MLKLQRTRVLTLKLQRTGLVLSNRKDARTCVSPKKDTVIDNTVKTHGRASHLLQKHGTQHGKDARTCVLHKTPKNINHIRH